MTTTHDSLRLTDVDPFVSSRPARAGQILGAIALDVIMPTSLMASGAVMVAVGQPALGVILVLGAIALFAVGAWLLGRTGRTLGTATVDARVVRRSTGAAAGAAASLMLVTRKLAMFDLRQGRDPFSAALVPFRFPPVAPSPVVDRVGRGLTPTLHLDSGERLVLDRALVLGRDPSAPTDAPAAVYRWADMSRTLSKSHVRLEWDGRKVWVTDLGSTNGTFVRGTGAPTPLLAHQRTPLPPNVVLETGDRLVTVRDVS